MQGGDPKGDGTGGPGYKTREAPPDDVAYTEGVVAMAKGGTEPAGTAGSQFFVVTGTDANLPADYAVLGKVTEGIENVKAMEALASTEDGPPERADRDVEGDDRLTRERSEPGRPSTEISG